MNIGVVTTSFPRHAGDYAGSFVGDRVRQLLAEGHAVDVLAAGDGGNRANVDAMREIEHARLTVTRIAPGPAGDRENDLFYGSGAPEALEQGGPTIRFAAARFSLALAAAVAKRAHHFDLIESHWLVPSALAALAAAPAGRHRAYAHSGDVALLERIPFGRAIARRLVRGGIALRFVSAGLQARFAALAGVPGPVGAVEPLIPYAGEWSRRAGVDVSGRRQLGLAGPTVLAVGRLVPIKGHDRLVRACGRVQVERAAVAAGALEVVILGDGPERARLGRLADELGVHLRLPGFVPRADVARWLRALARLRPAVDRPARRAKRRRPLRHRRSPLRRDPVLVESDVGRLAEGLSRQLHATATGV